jgi:hypothetical protein
MATEAAAGAGEARLLGPAEDPSGGRPTAAPGRIPPRTLAILTLGVMTVLFLVASFLASRALGPVSPAPPVPLVPVGTAAQVPGGTVTVLGVEHVAAPEPSAPVDSHAIQVRFLAQSDNDSTSRQLIGEMRLQGNGINGTLTPLENTREIGLWRGNEGGDFSLTYVVPDESSQLGVVLPGGAVVSVTHADHPVDE